MALPIPPLASGVLVIAGQDVGYHALTRAQAMQLNTFRGREDDAETYLLSCGTGVSIEDAAAWRGAVGWDVAGELVDAIIDISGLTELPGTSNGDEDEDSPKG